MCLQETKWIEENAKELQTLQNLNFSTQGKLEERMTCIIVDKNWKG